VSDIFGRRWIFVGGAALGVLGNIICAAAQNIPTLIGGTTIIGVAAATQLSYYYVMGELVPMKYRLAGNAFCYIFTIPGSGLSPVIAHALLEYSPAVRWRGCYIILVCVNFASLLCWFFFYHPPTFHMKHGNQSVLKYVREFDYVGTVLYTGGLLILMMGLNWGGTVYAWSSAHVITTIVVGFVAMVVFVLWECFAKLKEPLVPMHYFKNRGWNASVVLSGVGASVYYAFAIVWPSMVAIMYGDANDKMYGPWLSSFVGLFIIVGEVAGGLIAKTIGFLKWQCVVTILLGAICFGCMATCDPDTRVRASVLMAFGTFFIGWAESLAISIVTLAATDQAHLGSASGVAGSIRFLICSVSASIYNVILSNRLAQTIPAQVPRAVIAAGLPSSSVAAFIGAFSVGASAFAKIEGLTPEILAIGTRAYQDASADAYRTVFLSTIAFSAVAIVCTLLLPDADKLLTGRVATTLHDGKDEKHVVGE
jgi:hypothetical protein